MTIQNTVYAEYAQVKMVNKFIEDKAGTYILHSRQKMMEVIIMIMIFTYIITSSASQRK